MAKYYVKMNHSIEVAIEAPNEEAISDFLSRHTPDQVATIVARNGYGEVLEDFSDKIERELPQNSKAALIIDEGGYVI